MQIIPFKNRILDINKPVKIYRNLHSKDKNYSFSVMQNRLVVGHTGDLFMSNCTFLVNKNIQQKVRQNKRKLVHAFIKGTVINILPVSLQNKV